MQFAIPHHLTDLRRISGVLSVCVMAVAAASFAAPVFSQEKGKPQPAATAATVAKPPSAALPNTVALNQTKPDWAELSPADKVALKPLQSTWITLSAGRKRKWLELSKNYAGLSPSEQNTLQTRMSAWAALSPAQRAQARMNFAQNRTITDGLTPEQRKVQWDAYQLLSPEEKRKLAANSQNSAVGAATAIKPTQPLVQSPPPQYGTAKALAQAASAPGRRVTVPAQQLTGNSIVPQALSGNAPAAISK